MQALERMSIGVPGLDALLGGGLIRGTLTVVVGATGIGKTQLGLQFAAAGAAQERQRGVLFDMASRGDAQSHRDYAQRMFDWRLQAADAARPVELDGFFERRDACDYLRVFDYAGRRVTRADLGFEAWQEWQSELARKLSATIAFFYAAFVRGVRRTVIDGIEPVDRPSESIQFELFEYVYHQILRKDAEWVARDLFRERYRANAEAVAAHPYEPAAVACMLLYTSREGLLDDLITRPLDEGDVLSNANTLIYMGKIRQGTKLGRGLYIAKHRGSACADEIVPYAIDSEGLRIL